MRKKIALTMLLMAFIFSMGAVANAAVLASEYVNEARASITVNAQGTVNVDFRIYGTGVMDALGAKTIIVQEKASGSGSWGAVATYTADDYPNMMRYNTSRHSGSVSYSGAKAGYQYRAKVYFYAEKGGYEVIEYIAD